MMTTAGSPTRVGAIARLRCPRCASEMATFERSGIVIDQCPECRGIYLDQGELERLIDAESVAGWTGPRMRIAESAVLQRTSHAGRYAPAHPGYASEWRSDDDDGDRRRRRDPDRNAGPGRRHPR